MTGLINNLELFLNLEKNARLAYLAKEEAMAIGKTETNCQSLAINR